MIIFVFQGCSWTGCKGRWASQMSLARVRAPLSLVFTYFLAFFERCRMRNSSRSFFSHNPHTSTSHTRQTKRVPSPFRIYRHINRTHSLPLRTFTTAVSTKNPPPKQKCPIITKDDTFLDEERRYLIVPFILFLFLVTD